jgi:hypothetical protein
MSQALTHDAATGGNTLDPTIGPVAKEHSSLGSVRDSQNADLGQRHADYRQDQNRQDAAEDPGLRFGLPASDPDERCGPDHEHPEHRPV